MHQIDPFNTLPKPMHVELAVVRTAPAALGISGYEAAARYCEVTLQPGDQDSTARCMIVGQGAGRGLFVYPQVGDEVLVAFPGGRDNCGVIVGGLGNARSPHPSLTGGVGTLLHDGGWELRDTDTATVQEVALAPFVAAMKDHVTAIKSLVSAMTTFQLALDTYIVVPVPVPAQTATYQAASVVLQNAFATLQASITALEAQIDANSSPGSRYYSETVRASE